MSFLEIASKGSNNAVVGFGKAGWGIIIFCMAMFWFFVGFCTDGNNVSAPAAAAHLGTDAGIILTRNSYAGLIDGAILHATGSLRGAFIVIGCIAICDMIVVGITKDHKYNLDFQE